MKTLYISDLDGTLLCSNERTSDYTNRIINHLVEQGLLFSYATARSFQTARKVTSGLNAAIPLIVYNGAMVVDNRDGSLFIKNFFGPEVVEIIQDLLNHSIYPIVYAFIDDREVFSYLPYRCSAGMQEFLATRRNDPRERPVHSPEELMCGEIFYITCIDKAEKLEPLYAKYLHTCHCVFQQDLYTKRQWLELMPLAASKANAIQQLKEQLGCSRLVVFGDGKNDIDMFQLADEAYAVENAADELKAMASAVIGSNDADSVAKWLEQNAI